MSASPLRAGAALTDITPLDSQFLYGYPHVERMSTGTHDPLYAQALYLANGSSQVMFIGADLVWVPRPIVHAARKRIAARTGIPAGNIMISATHTHSGPIVGEMIIAEADPIVPKQDPKYLKLLEDRLVDAAIKAHGSAAPALVGLARADATGVGTNRHNPKGPAMLECPVLAVKDAASGKLRAVMTVCAMHPTVLHEDSKLYSGDFPGLARQYLAQKLGKDVVFVYHMGTAGNQSPRHVTKGNTLAETQRLGEVLGKAIEKALADVTYIKQADIDCVTTSVTLPLRNVPPIAEAKANLDRAVKRLADLRSSGAPRTDVRTAECDWFGAEESVTLAKAAGSGKIAAAARELMPAEIQLIRIGEWKFVGWPGEIFVEYGLQVRDADRNAFIITLAGGDLQGYLVTQEGIDKHWYEAGNALFKSPESPNQFVAATKQLLESITAKA